MNPIKCAAVLLVLGAGGPMKCRAAAFAAVRSRRRLTHGGGATRACRERPRAGWRLRTGGFWLPGLGPLGRGGVSPVPLCGGALSESAWRRGCCHCWEPSLENGVGNPGFTDFPKHRGRVSWPSFPEELSLELSPVITKRPAPTEPPACPPSDSCSLFLSQSMGSGGRGSAEGPGRKGEGSGGPSGHGSGVKSRPGDN